jgi:hypothetical protein
VAVEVVVASVEEVAGVGAEDEGDRVRGKGVEEDGDEAVVLGAGVVEDLLDEVALQGRAEAGLGGLVAVEAAAVGVGADDEDEVGLVDLAGHPLEPALGGMRLVLVEADVEAVLAEAIGEVTDAREVDVGVVGVGDEDAGGHGAERLGEAIEEVLEIGAFLTAEVDPLPIKEFRRDGSEVSEIVEDREEPLGARSRAPSKECELLVGPWAGEQCVGEEDERALGAGQSLLEGAGPVGAG